MVVEFLEKGLEKEFAHILEQHRPSLSPCSSDGNGSLQECFGPLSSRRREQVQVTLQNPQASPDSRSCLTHSTWVSQQAWVLNNCPMSQLGN